jgi:hypothetical protein
MRAASHAGRSQAGRSKLTEKEAQKYQEQKAIVEESLNYAKEKKIRTLRTFLAAAFSNPLCGEMQTNFYERGGLQKVLKT